MTAREPKHHPVGALVQVGGDQSLEPDEFAPVGAEPGSQPHHGADLDGGRAAHLRNRRGFRGEPVLVHGAEQLDAISPTLLGALSIGGVQRDHLKQTHTP